MEARGDLVEKYSYGGWGWGKGGGWGGEIGFAGTRYV